MAERLAAGRSARPIAFIGERSSGLGAISLWIGEQLSNQGHRVVLLDCSKTAPIRIANALDAAGNGSQEAKAVVLLVPQIEVLESRVLAALLDGLHLAARNGDPLGCILVGPPSTLAQLGALRSFTEALIEFRRQSSGSTR